MASSPFDPNGPGIYPGTVADFWAQYGVTSPTSPYTTPSVTSPIPSSPVGSVGGPGYTQPGAPVPGATTPPIPGQPTTTTPTPSTSQVPPSGGNLKDPAYAAQFVAYWADQPGANPSLKRDPNYWINKITSGELGPDEKYIISKFMIPEGGSAGGGGISNAPFGQFNQAFSAPTSEQALNSPGMKFALDQAKRAVESSAAAKGTLLTGGTLKALAGYEEGTALQGYNQLFNQQNQLYNTNYNVWRNNQNDTSNWLYNLAQLGKPA